MRGEVANREVLIGGKTLNMPLYMFQLYNLVQ